MISFSGDFFLQYFFDTKIISFFLLCKVILIFLQVYNDIVVKLNKEALS